MTPREVVEEVFPTMGGITTPTESYIPEGYAWVRSTPPVPYNPETHIQFEDKPKLTSGVWDQQWTTRELTDSEKRDRMIQRKRELSQLATQIRKDKEELGISLSAGIFKTSPEERTRLNASILDMDSTNVVSIDYYTNGVWEILTNTSSREVFSSVSKYARECYSAERRHHEEIEMIETLEQIHAYDISKYWP
jgi:hypothetical protein